MQFMQQLIPHFGVQPGRYEIIVRLEGMDGKRLYCDANEPNSVLFPFAAPAVSAEENIIVGAMFVPDLTLAELFAMTTKLIEQIATLFHAPDDRRDHAAGHEEPGLRAPLTTLLSSSPWRCVPRLASAYHGGASAEMHWGSRRASRFRTAQAPGDYEQSPRRVMSLRDDTSQEATLGLR
ncbi:MAG: hypothetical protein IPI49_20470 [Myxococcales bacterium]|nr:hypothetical protein [Myxococcales bacterium]